MLSFPLEIIEEAIADGTLGFCVYCGEEYGPIELDGREVECPCCKQKGVYGAEEILIMGLTG